MVSNVLISEAFGYGCSGIGTACLAIDLAETPLILCANDDIKKRYLTRMVEEPIVAVSFMKEQNPFAILERFVCRGFRYQGQGRRLFAGARAVGEL